LIDYICKKKGMTTIIINEHTEKGKSLLAFLEKFKGEDFVIIEKTPNKKTRRAINESMNGCGPGAKNLSDLMDALNQ
jgi:hypothetical protein